MMANTRSMPMETPTAGTSLPLNMPTSLSYLGFQPNQWAPTQPGQCLMRRTQAV
jgi:hypothetical protein